MRIHVLEPEGDVLVFLTGQEEIEAMVGGRLGAVGRWLWGGWGRLEGGCGAVGGG
jgi:hypothetical protein